MRCVRWIVAILLIAAQPVAAQNKLRINTIPLQQSITVNIEGGDYQLLQCYNLYGFHYYDGIDSVLGEFIVKKDLDTFVNRVAVNLKLCRVHEFDLLSMGKCRAMPVEMGIQLNFPDRKEMIFLNFDPEGPEPVFMPCK